MNTLNLLQWKNKLKIYKTTTFIYHILRKNLIMLCKWKISLDVLSKITGRRTSTYRIITLKLKVTKKFIKYYMKVIKTMQVLYVSTLTILKMKIFPFFGVYFHRYFSKECAFYIWEYEAHDWIFYKYNQFLHLSKFVNRMLVFDPFKNIMDSILMSMMFFIPWKDGVTSRNYQID